MLKTKNPSKDFIRNRKLPFEQMIKGILAMSGKSLNGEIMDYFDKKESESFYQNSKGYKPFNLLHLNVLYDLNRNIYTDAIVQPIKYRIHGKHTQE